MRGIVLAGGMGTRLWPLTKSLSKQILPVYDKPMIFYPISTLMMAGIREILIITTPRDVESFKTLLGNGNSLGIEFSYEVQHEPKGLAQAFLIGENFIGSEKVALILGDNIFHGVGLGGELEKYLMVEHAQIFAYPVSQPSEYGVVEFDASGRVVSLEEKPSKPKSSFAIPGLYFYDNSVIDKARSLEPSSRGELEITTVNQKYLAESNLKVSILPRGTAWFDTGTFENMYDASNYVRILERRQGIKVANLEEVAWRKGWVTDESLETIANEISNFEQKSFLLNLLSER